MIESSSSGRFWACNYRGKKIKADTYADFLIARHSFLKRIEILRIQQIVYPIKAYIMLSFQTTGIINLYITNYLLMNKNRQCTSTYTIFPSGIYLHAIFILVDHMGKPISVIARTLSQSTRTSDKPSALEKCRERRR